MPRQRGGGASPSTNKNMRVSGEQPVKKRKQHCTFCKNHGIISRKNGHVCKHKDCECLLCQLTTKAQVAMRHQQALWRHQGREMAKNKNFPQHGLTNRQLCDKCRNHGEFFKKRGHKSDCKFEKCDCPLCQLTDKRRLVMKHQQRVRRANVTAKVISSDDEDSNSESHEGAQQNDGAEALEGYDEGSSEEAIAGAVKAVTLAIEALPKHFGPFSPSGVVSRTNKSSAVNRACLKHRILKTEFTLPRKVNQSETLQPPVTTKCNVQQYLELGPNSWLKPDNRMSPPDSRTSPRDSRMSPPDSRTSPPDSRMSPPDSRTSPPDSRMSPPASVASYSIAKYSPQTPKYSPQTPKYSPQTPKYSPQTPKYSPQMPKYSPQTPMPSQSTPPLFEATAPIKQEIKDEDGWPNAPVTEPSLIHSHFPTALPPHTGAPMLLPPSHSTYLNRMPPFYPLVSQADEACATPQMFSPPRGNMPPMFSSARSFLFKKSPQSDYSSMSKAFDSCKNRSIRDMREGCHNYENDSGVVDRDEFMYEKLFSRGVIGHPRERITVRDSISVTQTAPSNALEGLDYFAKMQLQRQFPEHFARIAEQTYPAHPPARHHPPLSAPLVGSQPGMDAALHNPIQPCPVRLLPPELRWPLDFLRYPNPISLMYQDPLLSYNPMFFPRSNRNSP
ncbi:doublesex- and mab-3-related transcription factor A2 isoform X3 [Hyalella azteca]|nr:doublesex- and mab-3-related transcription factor A2 isoform X3 [Hyalella azteca]